MTKMQEQFVVTTSDSTPISGALWRSDSGSSKLAVFLHGFSSSKESSTNSALIPSFLALGVNVASFDFRGCGSSGGNLGSTTISTGLRDLNAVMELMRSKFQTLASQELFFVGSSFGGTVAIAATKFFAVKGLLLKSPMTDIPKAQLQARGAVALSKWKRDGFLRLERRSGSVDLSYDYVRDAENYDLFDPLYCLTGGHTIIVHGSADKLAPVAFSNQFVKLCTKTRELYVIRGADHQFRIPAHFDRMVELLNEGSRRIVGK